VEIANELTNVELCGLFAAHGFITGSPAMMPLLRQARKAAVVSDITVLLEGETGTGKQVLAQAIHNLDEKRRAFPFITVHRSTIGEPLDHSRLPSDRRVQRRPVSSGLVPIRAVLGDELHLLARTELLPGNRDQAGRAAGDRFHFSGGACHIDPLEHWFAQ
jgi:hypothetical protein